MADVEGGLLAAILLPTAGYFGKLAVDSFLAFRRRKRFCIRAIDALDVEIRGIVDSAKPIKDNLDQGLASGLIDQRIAENGEYAPYFPVARLGPGAGRKGYLVPEPLKLAACVGLLWTGSLAR